MRNLGLLTCLMALLGLLLVQCGDATEAGAGRGGGGGGDAPELAVLHGYLYEFDSPPWMLRPGDPPPTMLPLAGVRVCQLDTDNCTTSDAEGIVKLDVPRTNEETAFTMEKDGYGSWVYPNVTDEEFHEGHVGPDPTIFPMYTDEHLATIAEQLGTPYPWRGGMVALIRWVSPHPGVKFIPVGPTVDQVGESFYWDASTGQYSVDATATPQFLYLTEYPLAEGGFAEVTPGVQQFEFAGTAGVCTHASWAWPGDAPNRIRVPVLDGYITYGSMRCDDEIP
ncbi:MAG: hypothetical protein WBN38_19955 [Polyangiales bacterium]